MYPKLYNSNGQVLAVLDNIIKETASIKRVVNGEFTFAFEAYEKELKSEYFNPDNNIIVDDQTFDIKYIEQEHEIDVQYAIQCEHVNYRMEDGEENLFPLYTYTGTPTQILSNILAGTEFSVGTVEFTDTITITVNAEITRKSLIYELANTLGGEVDYTNLGFTINILASIGKNNGFQARFGKNLKGIRKIIDNRDGLKTYYSVDIIMLKNSDEYIEKELRDFEIIDVGDTIQLIDPVVGLNLQNRIISREYNPIFEVNTKLEIANNIELITTKIKQIETSTVHKNKIYNGVYISAEDGFVAERSDGKAKTIMNATEGISIYSDIGLGLAKNFFVGLDGRIQAKGIDIDGSGTFSGDLSAAGGTFSGTISASTIIGSTLIGGSLTVGTNYKVSINEQSLNGLINFSSLGGTSFASIGYNEQNLFIESNTKIFQYADRIQIEGSNSLALASDGVMYGNAPDIALTALEDDIRLNTPYGKVYYNNNEISTQSWTTSNFASLGHNHGNTYVQTSQNVHLTVTASGIYISADSGQYVGSIMFDT